MFKKAKLYSLLAIIVASTAVGLFGGPQVVSAQQTGDSGQNDEHFGWSAKELEESARLKSYGMAMKICLSFFENSAYSITEDDARQAGYKWIGKMGDYGIHVGYITDPNDDGKISCEGEGRAIVEGYKTLRPSTYTDSGTGVEAEKNRFAFMCELGFRPYINRKLVSGYDEAGPDKNMFCYDIQADNTDVRFSIPGSAQVADYSLTSAEQYVSYLHALRNAKACNAKFVAFEGGEVGGNDDLLYIPIVYNNPIDDKTVVFEYTKNDAGVSVFPGAGAEHGNTSDDDIDCSDIQTGMEDTFGDYKTWLGQNGSTNNGGGGNPPTPEGEAASTCRIDGIGWIICPVMNFLATIADGSYALLEGSLLRAAPVGLGETTADGSPNGLLHSWRVMRDIANVLFIIAFLVIVFSQITSFGISNYGLKKMLPRLVVAAILVNISYYISAVAVDISNFLGTSLKDLLGESLAGKVSSTPPTVGNGGEKEWVGWAAITAGILALGAGDIGWQMVVGQATPAAAGFSTANTVLLSILVPVLLTVLFVVVLVVVALIIRQALITLLIVISPLAIVAWLLPNTENYFGAWRKMFQTLLLMYPIIAVVFGASTLASTIIMSSSDSIMVQIAGAAAGVIPLFIVPSIIKASGGILNRFTGIVNDPNKGPIDALRRRAADGRDYNRAMRGKRVIKGVGDFVDGDSLGGKGSRRKRALTYLTSYGRDTSSRRHKDALAEAENSNEQVYLDSKQGSQARADMKTSQVNLETANLNVENLRLTDPGGEGRTAETQKYEAEAKKQLVATESQTQAIQALQRSNPRLLERTKDAERAQSIAETESKVTALAGANTDLAMQAKTSTQRLTNAEGRVDQAYEEMVAGQSQDPSSADSTTRAAQSAREESKKVAGATAGAKSVSEDAFTEKVLSTPALAQAIGGIDPEGAAKAQSAARFAQRKEQREQVEREKSVVENLNLNELNEIMKNDENTAKKAAALERIVKISDPEDYESYVNEYGSAVNLSTGLDKTPEEIEREYIIRHTMTDAISKYEPALAKESVLDMINNNQLGKAQLDKEGNETGNYNPKNLQEIVRVGAAAGDITQAKIVGASSGAIRYISTHADDVGKLKLKENAIEAKKNTNLSLNIKNNSGEIDSLANAAIPFVGPVPTGPPPQASPASTPNSAPAGTTAGTSTTGWSTTTSGFIHKPQRPTNPTTPTGQTPPSKRQ